MARKKFIKVRVTEEEYQAAHRVSEARGKTLSDDIRGFLARLAKRAEADQAASE